MKRQVYLMILAVVTATGMLLGTFAHLGHGRAFGFWRTGMLMAGAGLT